VIIDTDSVFPGVKSEGEKKRREKKRSRLIIG
jgi:hypothetical protein